YDIVHLFPTGEDRLDITNINDNDEYLVECNSIAPRQNIYLGSDLSFISDCSKIATYVKNYYSKLSIEKESDRCKYLNYSINDIVKNDENQKYNKEKFVQAYSGLAKRLNKCESDIKVIEVSVLEKVKELSNIYYEFDKYLKVINKNETTDCQGLPNIVQLYLNDENRCKGAMDKFCNAVEKFKNYYHLKISEAKCKNAVYTLESPLSLDHNKHLSFEEGQKREDRAEELEEGSRGQVMSDFTPNQEDFPEMGQSKSTITTASSIILVMSSASFILYKFTPLGTWLRPLVQRKNKKTISMYDEALRFNNNSSFQTNNSGNAEFNLQYHSS
ncbi:PIR protein, partial [Plasmodium vivax]